MPQIFSPSTIRRLVEKKIIKEREVERITGLAEKSRFGWIDVLLDEKVMTEAGLCEFLSEEWQIPNIDPENLPIDPELLDLIPRSIAKKYDVLPIERKVKELIIATSNPMDLSLLDALKVLTGLRIKPLFALPKKIQDAIRKHYGTTPHEESEENAFQTEQSEEMESVLKELQEKAPIAYKETPDLATQTTESSPLAIRTTNLVLLDGVRRRASDLFIEPWERKMTVRCRVDGILEPMKSPPITLAPEIVSRIKVMSSLNIAEHRVPQDGRFKAKIKGREIDFRVNVIPTQYGEKVCIRLLDKSGHVREIAKLGLPEHDLQLIREASLKPHGMILVTGPTGSGKTTTLYAVLNFLHTPEKNITTVEDPVEYQINGINQVQVKEHIGLTFAASLRSILRQDPDIIMVGEIRDLETMDIAIKSALTGHLVLSTLHTNDAASSIVRMVDMGVEPFLISSSILLITAQRLIRRLCENCKESYSPGTEVMKKMEVEMVDQTAQFFKPVGCRFCRGLGYLGRQVITEIFEFSDEIKSLVMKSATTEEIKAASRRQGMRTLRERALEYALRGETAIDEVFRVTFGDQTVTATR